MINCNEKIYLTFKGRIDNFTLTDIKGLLKCYQVYMFDLSLHNLTSYQTTIHISLKKSSISDKKDSFWQDIENLAENLDLQVTKDTPPSSETI